MHAQYLRTPGLEHCHIVLAWHGCSLEVVRSICAFGAVDLRKVDGGRYNNKNLYTHTQKHAPMLRTRLHVRHIASKVFSALAFT